MKIIHLGVGEAVDEHFPNNSHLVLSNTTLLLDCGYSVPRALWKYNSDPNFLDAIYISHWHADHYFGLPPLLGRMWEEGRTKTLTLICQNEGQFEKIMEMGYKGMMERFGFEIEVIEIKEEESIDFNEFSLSFAPTIHGVYNLAVRIETEGKALCYSGDGQFIDKTVLLYKSADLLIQETYLFDKDKDGHAKITETIEMAEKNGVKNLALTHINRNCRQEDKEKIGKALSEANITVYLPKPLEEFSL